MSSPPKRKRYTQKSDLTAAILNADLSPTTKRVYLERLATLVDITGRSLFTILKYPDTFVPILTKRYEQLATRKSYISAILAVFRHNEGLRLQEYHPYYKWYDAFKELDQAIEAKYKSNEPSEKQKAGYTPFRDIVAKRDTLPEGSDERLLLSFYTYIPPLRCDFNHIRIFRSEEAATAAPTASDDANYIVFQHDTSASADNLRGYLILKEYKTSNKHEEAFRKNLPAPLLQQLRLSLRKYPRDYLFADKDNKPLKPNTYTRWANRTLQRLFERPLTVSLIRHAFINGLDFNKMTIQDKEAIAKDMAHTAEMQDKYRLIFEKDDQETPIKASAPSKSDPDGPSNRAILEASSAKK